VNPYGQPQANPYGQPQQPANPYGQPQQPGNPYGQPQANPYGQQPANPYAQPQQPAGYPQHGGYPQAANPYAQSAQDAHGGHGLGDFAHKLPQSAPGTIFGFPVATLRDQILQKKILFLAGVALLVSVAVPTSLSPLQGLWTGMTFGSFIWPLIAGLAYLLLTAAPADIRAKVPPVVLQWIPFAVAYAGIFISHMGGMGMLISYMSNGGSDSLFILGYSVLVFGLLARIAQPQDQIARIVIAAGAACLIPTWIGLFHVFGGLGPFGLSMIVPLIIGILTFLVVTLGVLCLVFVVPPAKLPPALQAVDAFAPLVAALLIVWLPLTPVLFALAGIVREPKHILDVILGLGHMLLPIVAYFGVLMMASPAAYEEAKAMFDKAGGGGPGGYPPAGGGYPPPGGGGYPPQGGGYPPQGGGGYPPQGGGYPPQGGGGYPPQGGGWQ
jgi:hypothetical protein